MNYILFNYYVNDFVFLLIKAMCFRFHKFIFFLNNTCFHFPYIQASL